MKPAPKQVCFNCPKRRHSLSCLPWTCFMKIMCYPTENFCSSRLFPKAGLRPSGSILHFFSRCLPMLSIQQQTRPTPTFAKFATQAQGRVALGTLESTVKVRTLGKSWSMCGRYCRPLDNVNHILVRALTPAAVTNAGSSVNRCWRRAQGGLGV